VRQKGTDSEWFNAETVTVWRRALSSAQCSNLEHQNLCASTVPLRAFAVNERGRIEDANPKTALHCDFANAFVGGGVLEGGNVQEEIRFTVNTEALISKFLCPRAMRNNESILIFGSRQFFEYDGYGSSFRFAGNIRSPPTSAIVAIDALYLFTPSRQIRPSFLARELAKAFVGFSAPNERIGRDIDTVATGNWGCGIFRGDPKLKAMLQWIAASLCKRNVAYFTFDDRRVANGALNEFIAHCAQRKEKLTVGRLWTALCNVKLRERYEHGQNLFELLREALSE